MPYPFRPEEHIYIPFKNGLSVVKTASSSCRVYTKYDIAKNFNPLAKIVEYAPVQDDTMTIIHCENCKYWQVNPVSLRVYCVCPAWKKPVEKSPQDFCSEAVLAPAMKDAPDDF